MVRVLGTRDDGLSEALDRLATVEDPNLQTVDIQAVSSSEEEAVALADATAAQLVGYIAVSYTHLTLPTNSRV